MIFEKLILADNATQHHTKQESKRLTAFKSIRELLKQVDFTAEVLPEEDPERMIKLLHSLKGEPLNTSEVQVIYELVKD